MIKRALSVSLLMFFTITPALAGPVDEMIAADRAFAQLAKHEGVAAAFAAYAAEDVHMFPDGGQPYAGRDAMMARFANWPDGVGLSWTPVDGMASAAGDFGFTWGRFVSTAGGEKGPTQAHGKYVSIWRKDKDGVWKFVADIGNSNPAPAAPAAPQNP